jgi:hypothetical protein
MAVMKYTPQFTERQYVPMNDIGLIQNIISKKEKEYDMARAMEHGAVSQLYGLDTTQGFEPKRNELIQGLQGQIEEAVQKRGGDYGAAIQDIMGVVSKAQSDPFFQRNRQVMEKGKMLDQMLARNPNLMVFNDPRKLGYREDLGAEDLEYSVFDPEDIDKGTMNLYGNLGKQVREGSPIFNPQSGYNEAVTIRGLTQAEADRMIQDEETYKNVLNNFPQLQDKLNDPNLSAQFKQRIAAQIQGLVQGQQRQFLNPLTPKAGGTGEDIFGQGSGLLYVPNMEANPRLYNRVEKDKQALSEVYDSEGNIHMKEVSVESGKYEKPDLKNKRFTLGAGMAARSGGLSETMQAPEMTREEYVNRTFQRYKNDYSSIYKKVRESGGSDKDFVEWATDLEKNKAFVGESRLGVNDKEFTDNLFRRFSLEDEAFLEMKDGKVTDKSIDVKKLHAGYKDTGLTFKDAPTFITPQGELVIRHENKEYAVKKTMLPVKVTDKLQNFGEMYDTFYDFKMKPSDIEQMNRRVYSFGNMSVQMVSPDGDPSNKYILLEYIDPRTGTKQRGKVQDIGVVYDMLAKDLSNVMGFKKK